MLIFITLLLCLVLFIFLFLHHEFSYWKRRHFPYSRKYNWVMGNIGGMGTRALCDIFQDVYDELKNQGPLGGIFLFTKPVALVTCPNLLKNILIKDFDHFHDRVAFLDEHRDPLTMNLFALEGEKWKRLRAKLTPTFSSGKIKMMFGMVVNVADDMENYIDKLIKTNSCIEVKDVLTRFTVDVIGTCAFGIECSSFHHPTSEFKEMGMKVFGSTTKLKLMKYFLIHLFPGISKVLGMKVTDSDVERFFMQLCRETLTYRHEHHITRNDFFNLLMQLQNQNKLDLSLEDGEEHISFSEFVAQCFVFFVAGFETTSILMTFILYELAKNPHVQEKVRREINTVLAKQKDGAINYEALNDLTYLDCVVNEVLRLYPPLINLQRVVTKDYKVPNTNCWLRKGDFVYVPLYSIQRDPDFFPNPSEFIPERFSDENLNDIKPFTFLPFGDGPRVCVGQRFGMMEVRVGLVTLLKRFRFTLGEKMPKEIEISPFSGTLMPMGGIWLNIERINST